MAAQVIDIGSANFEQSIEINRGSTQGVAIGQPVVSAGGLIGKVTSVSAHLATVTLLDDPSFTVGVRVVRTGIVGAAAGLGQGNLLQIENVEVGATRKARRRVSSRAGFRGSTSLPASPSAPSPRSAPGRAASSCRWRPSRMPTWSTCSSCGSSFGRHRQADGRALSGAADS